MFLKRNTDQDLIKEMCGKENQLGYGNRQTIITEITEGLEGLCSFWEESQPS